MKKRLLALLCAILMLVCFPIVSFADFGDYAGDSDYGSNDSYGSYNDYDSYGSNNSYYDDDDDDERTTKATTTYYGYIKNSHDDDSFGGYFDPSGNELTIDASFKNDINEGGNTALVGLVLIGGITLIIVLCKRKDKLPSNHKQASTKAPLPSGATPVDPSTLKHIVTYKGVDPSFDENELKEKLSNIYVQMQNGWQDKNIQSLRPYFTDAQFAQFDRQLDAYRRNNQTNYIERIAVLDVSFSGWTTQGENDVIVAIIKSRIIDYVLDDKTGKLIRGDRNKEKFMTYEWTLTRKSGTKTGVNSGIKTINCPNCGAAVDINKSAQCPYCNSIITVDATDWTISLIKGISQQTGR